jgi:hypothetical protein
LSFADWQEGIEPERQPDTASKRPDFSKSRPIENKNS